MTAAVASANVTALGLSHLVRIEVGDVTDPSVLGRALTGVDAAYVDPARRDPATRRDGRSERVTNPASWSPPWTWVEQVAARIPRTAAKVAPGVPHEMTPPGGCATWTSVDGQLVEAEIAWPAMTSTDARRCAVVLRGDTRTGLSSSLDLADEIPPSVGDVGTWLLEPDDAVIRSGLVGALTTLLDGRLLDSRVAYVTTDVAPSDDPLLLPLAARFRIERALPFDLDRLRDVLVAEDIGHVVVKKRAINADPDDVRHRLALTAGSRSAVVVLTRIGDDPWAFVCDPVGR